MQDVPFITPSERKIYVEYDRQRRLRLSRGIAPVFATILMLVLIASAFIPDMKGTRSHFGLVLLCAALFILATASAWRDRVNLATGSILAGALLLMILAVLVNQPFILSDLLTIPACVIIGLAALVGVPWMILATAVCTSVIVIVLSHSPSLGTELADPNNVASTVAFVIEQWALAAVVYAAARGYQRTLRETGDVRVQYERARKLDELKDQFITNVNHELRNPVMLMQGYIELLRLKGQEMTQEKRAELVQRASKAGDHLTELLQSILDARRLDHRSDTFVGEAVPVRETLEVAASLVDPRSGQHVERQLRVNMPAGLAVWGERIRLQQILANLLSNAVKYSQPGTPVEVSVRIVTESAPTPTRWLSAPHSERDMVEIAVRDFGLGIPPDEVPVLFERFVRLPRDLASSVSGNGLGLYLCRELTQAMGGSIRVESTGIEGEGSTFYVRLPLPPREPEDAGSATDEPAEMTAPSPVDSAKADTANGVAEEQHAPPSASPVEEPVAPPAGVAPLADSAAVEAEAAPAPAEPSSDDPPEEPVPASIDPPIEETAIPPSGAVS
jgi:signal transduction histidine kinase